MGRTRMVVIGGDAAGMSAASSARRRRPASDLEIVAFERGEHTSYSACGLPYLAGGVVEDWHDLVVRTPEQFAEQDITAKVRHEVQAIDLDARRVTVRDLDAGRTIREPFDILVVATGSEPVRPPIPGIDLPGVYGLSILRDGIELRAAIDAGPKAAVVIGGGYIGLEAAEQLVNRDVPTTLVEQTPQVMNQVDPDMGELVGKAVAGLGVTLYLEEEVEEIEAGDDGRVAAVRTSARTIPADLVVLGLGSRPSVELAESAGIPIGPSGGIRVNRRMRTPVEGVWAAGDCAETIHVVTGEPVNYHLGTIANKQGRICGTNIGGGYVTFPGVLGTAVTKVCDLEVARTGLGERDLGPLGIEAESGTVESTTRAGYYPGAEQIHTKILAERRSGRLLGAQIVGREGAAKRIDVLAAALWNGMTVHDLVNMDVSYAPPFAPVWDPVLISARKLSEQITADLERC
jgi:NADPH-dependent 2,4-dienoyl-CoA reductase/sulfur reductase-like enzyme